MARVVISTITGLSNFGNNLQNYALQETLEGMGYEVKTIFRENNLPIHTNRGVFQRNMDPEYRLMRVYYFIARMAQIPRFVQNKLSSKTHQDDENVSNVLQKNRFRKFQSFRRNYIKDFNEVPFSTFEDYQQVSNAADFMVIGSDQVWNPTFWHGPYIEFGEYFQGKTISYAASIGVARIPRTLKRVFNRGFNSLDAISVREKNAVDMVKKTSGRDAELVLDPSLLLTKEQWSQLSLIPVDTPKKYVLVYFLSALTPERIDHINKIAKDLNSVVVDILSENLYSKVGPAEFLGFIENAQYVFTDSFHACVFSSIFHVEFESFHRTEKSASGMAARIDTLFAILGIKPRWYDENTTQENIDFAKVDQILKKKIALSTQWLAQAIDSQSVASN